MKPFNCHFNYLLIAYSLIIGSAISCKVASDDNSIVKTDLSASGNFEVTQRFKSFMTKDLHCTKPTSSHKRVILTGFGLFTGVSYNISGMAIEAMSKQQYWPDVIDEIDYQERLSQLSNNKLIHIELGALRTKDRGGRIAQRTLSIQGNQYEVCFINLDVIWDLAAAIIMEEAERFQPDMIIMTGRGNQNLIFEGGALNQVNTLHGFDNYGNPVHQNTPAVNTTVLPPESPGVQNHIKMNWDGINLNNINKDIFTAMKLQSLTPDKGRKENTYICNNTAYVVGHGIKGVTLELAGKKLILNPSAIENCKFGFMHFSLLTKNRARDIFQLNMVLARIIDATLKEELLP
ncbi:MAG: hypothetical protein CMP10_20765 [Zetaproteobacteria bacterium]|nr:hypothetical protein [Pseudobdellovibrionaceae bacterium]